METPCPSLIIEDGIFEGRATVGDTYLVCVCGGGSVGGGALPIKWSITLLKSLKGNTKRIPPRITAVRRLQTVQTVSYPPALRPALRLTLSEGLDFYTSAT